MLTQDIKGVFQLCVLTPFENVKVFVNADKWEDHILLEMEGKTISSDGYCSQSIAKADFEDSEYSFVDSIKCFVYELQDYYLKMNPEFLKKLRFGEQTKLF